MRWGLGNCHVQDLQDRVEMSSSLTLCPALDLARPSTGQAVNCKIIVDIASGRGTDFDSAAEFELKQF